MAITPQSFLHHPELAVEGVTVEQALAYLDPKARADPFTRSYVAILHELCRATGIRFAIAFAQFCDETGKGTSWYWWNKRNPAGIGALPDGTYVGITYQRPVESAGGQLVHLWLYAMGPELPPELEPYLEYDPRWQAAQGNAGKGARLIGLANTWATNPNYAVQIAGHANACFGGAIPEGASKMSYTTSIPGLPGGPITTSFPIRVQLVPLSLSRVRPGILATPTRRSIQHETANRWSFAKGEAEYLLGGAGGRTVSYHGAVDDQELWVMIPLNEVTWQAGDGAGPGNYKGYSLELCVPDAIVNDTARRQRSQAFAAEFMGIVGARLHADEPEQHADYLLKNCPRWLRERPSEWARYVDIWWTHYRAEKARMGQGADVPAIGDTVKGTSTTKDALNLRGGPSTGHNILTTMPAGAGVEVMGEHLGGWYPVRYAELKGWAHGDYLTPVVPVVTEPDTPPVVYAEPIPIEGLEEALQALLEEAKASGADPDELRYNRMPGVVTDEGMRFITVWDVVEVTEETPRLQQGIPDGPIVGKPLVKGERFVAGWLFVAAAGDEYYLTPPVYDEGGTLLWGWTRVQRVHTKRIADAPLLGGDTQPPD